MMKSLSILIADDEALIRVDIKGMLERAGHRVCAECCNGIKAVELAKQQSPDLAILDMKMPGLDGLETAKILHTLNIPAVMVTAYSQPQFISRAENVYVCGYLVKPIFEQNLAATVRIAYARWNDMQHMRQELAATKDRLEQQKWIAHAKAVLVDHGNISAIEAHQRLVRESMRRQLPLVEMAKLVISNGKI
jgi:response regulator NasT